MIVNSSGPTLSKRPVNAKTADKLSIVIPCYNEVDHIGALLDSIARQTFNLKDMPVIIADAGSVDGTLGFLEEYQQHSDLNILVIPGGLPAYGRNRGAWMTDSEYILFLDADVVLGILDDVAPNARPIGKNSIFS